MSNPDQGDADADGVGDACDPTPGFATQDKPGVQDNSTAPAIPAATPGGQVRPVADVRIGRPKLVRHGSRLRLKVTCLRTAGCAPEPSASRPPARKLVRRYASGAHDEGGDVRARADHASAPGARSPGGLPGDGDHARGHHRVEHGEAAPPQEAMMGASRWRWAAAGAVVLAAGVVLALTAFRGEESADPQLRALREDPLGRYVPRDGRLGAGPTPTTRSPAGRSRSRTRRSTRGCSRSRRTRGRPRYRRRSTPRPPPAGRCNPPSATWARWARSS